MVIHAFAALLPVIASRPHRVPDGVTRPFVKTLPQNLGQGRDLGSLATKPRIIASLVPNGSQGVPCGGFVSYVAIGFGGTQPAWAVQNWPDEFGWDGETQAEALAVIHSYRGPVRNVLVSPRFATILRYRSDGTGNS